MKNLILLAVFALATACSSNPRYNAIKEYNELQFSRCIEKIPEEQREKHEPQCARTALQESELARRIYGLGRADRDYKDCLANNSTPESINECYGMLQREYYDMYFKVPTAKAETYRLSDIYEFTLPEGWLVLKKTPNIQKENGIERLDQPEEKANTDFIANKTGSKEYLLLRITSVSGAPAEKNFASQSSADFNTLKAKKLSDLEAKWKPENSQVSEYKASKVQFSGTSALRVENIIETPDGSRFFDIEYTIYGPSSTITAGVTQNISKESLDSAKLEKILAGLSVLAK
jgi:hypothetical protein